MLWATLKAKIADWTNRNDLTTQNVDFFNMGVRELERMHDFRHMRVRYEHTLSDDDYSFTNPIPNYKKLINVHLYNSNGFRYAPLDIVPASYATKRYPNYTDTKGRPEMISLITAVETDYTDDVVYLNLSDLAMTAGGTTLTSATGGFTAAMVGKFIQIISGTNFKIGSYYISARTDTNTVTIDRDATTGSNGSVGVGYIICPTETWLLRPTCNASYTLELNAYQYTPLIDESTHLSNWWTQNAWDIGLYAALVEYVKFSGDTTNLAIWAATLKEKLAFLIASENDEEISGSYQYIHTSQDILSGSQLDIESLVI